MRPATFQRPFPWTNPTWLRAFVPRLSGALAPRLSGALAPTLCAALTPVLCAALALLLAASIATAQEPEDLTSAQRVDTLFAPFDRTDGPGAAVTVILDGEVVHERGYGMADLEHGLAITPSTRFQVASVSKQFTAFAIRLLEAEGKLSLDDDIREHLPEMHDFGSTITVGHMVHHTSGLREPSTLQRLAGWRSGDATTQEDLLAVAFRLRELNFEPGSQYTYNNLGYTLLAEIVERVSGQPFREFLDERVFGPLQMTSSLVNDNRNEVIPNRARSYARAGDGWEERTLNFEALGSTGIFTTVEDLVRWDQNFYDAAVGGAQVIRAMQEPGRLNDGTELTYASGLMLPEYRGVQAVHHTGSHAAYRIALFRVPEHRFTAIILSNDAALDRNEMPRRVADIYLEDVLDPVEPPVAEADEPDAPAAEAERAEEEATEDREPTLTADEMEAFVGHFYSPEAEALVQVEVEEGELVLHFRKGRSTLQYRGDDTFSGVGSQVRFLRSDDGSVAGFLVSNARLTGLRFLPADLVVHDEGW